MAPPKCSECIFVLYLASFLAIAVTTMSALNFIVQNFRDILASAEAFGPFSTEVISIVKFVTFHYRTAKFCSMIEKAESLTMKGENNFFRIIKFLS